MDHFPSRVLSRQLVTPNDPDAGAEWSVTVGADEIHTSGAWLLKSVAASLEAGSEDVQPFLVFADAAGQLISESVGATAAQSAGSTCRYCWAGNVGRSGLQGASSDVHSQSPLPMGTECLLQQGWQISSRTIGLSSTSEWSAIVLYVVSAE